SLDPAAAANQRIVDLDRAPTADDGTVQFEADVCVLRPADGPGSRRLLFVVANRGLLGGVPLSARPTPWGSTELEPGDGFVLGRGWTLAWCGWQWDGLRRPGAVGLDARQALQG